MSHKKKHGDSSGPMASNGRFYSSAPRRNLPHGKRIFDLNLSDRVEGVWDSNIPLVQQAIIEGVGIDDQLLGSQQEIENRCEVICVTFNLTVIQAHSHFFGPGLSGVLILGESHLAYHSWPEKGYINIDIVTCHKRGVDPVRLSDLFAELFDPTSLRCHKIFF